MNEAAALINWYKKNKRDLPWRNTTDAYVIWLSEIILQQTRVEQGLPYFNRFLQKFPAVHYFANAREEEILKMWQGLGYYTRARNMLITAKTVVKEYNGNFPEDYDELKKLKGIGSYTAAAITSFAFDKPHAVIDGNVYRFLSRYYGIKTQVDSLKGKKIFEKKADELLDKKHPALFNQAIMEFGAMQCKPVNPLCSQCLLTLGCVAYQKKSVNKFPVKNKKQKIRNRFFNYFFLESNGYTFLGKRTKNDIWKNLYELPLIETEKKTGFNELLKSKKFWRITGGNKFTVVKSHKEFIHLLSHQKIIAGFYSIKLSGNNFTWLKKNTKKIPVNTLHQFPVSKLTEKILKTISV